MIAHNHMGNIEELHYSSQPCPKKQKGHTAYYPVDDCLKGKEMYKSLVYCMA